MNNKDTDNDTKALIALAKTAYDHIEPLAKSLNSVFKEEPNLKRVLMLFKLPGSISDAIFMHKFDVFYEAGKLNDASIKKLNKQLTGNKKSHFWKLIFTSIQSHDDDKRSALVGKVVVALTEEKITYQEAVRMIHASNTVNVENLNYLLNLYLDNSVDMPGYAIQEFVTVGLLGLDQSRIGTWDSFGGATYPLVDFGARYLGAIYDYPVYPKAKNIRLGEDRLVNAGKDTSSSFRKELPITLVMDKGYWYNEAALIIRDKDKILLVDQDPIVVSSPIFVGVSGKKVLSNITKVEEEHFKPVYIYTDTERKVSVHIHTLDNKLANSIPKPSNGVWTDYRSLLDDKYPEFLNKLADAISKYDESQLGNKPVGPYDYF